jgi:tRNA pseudouridine32 synthase/23S rRNA pseudouridine746 synthase
MPIPHVYQPPAHDGLDIVYQDPSLLVINKPAGLLTVPGKGEDKQDSLIGRVQLEYPEALIVHRLDMATSGLLIVARNKSIQGKIGGLFQNRIVKKEYIAVVSGRVEPIQGIVHLPLMTDWPNRPKQMVDFMQGKPSTTHFRLLGYENGNNSRIELTPLTGRTHQLRVHMQSIGHTIIGDRLYSSEEAIPQNTRLLLHAARLQFIHPNNKQHILCESPVPF